MSRVSLSGLEKSIDDIWIWHGRVSGALRLRIADERSATSPPPTLVFLGLTNDDVDQMFAELDLLTMLDLLSATEAAVRVDFWQRVQARRKDGLSRRFRALAKEHDERVGLEDHLLDAWSQERRDLRPTLSDFKGALKLRHWLAHGRYWTPRLARQSYAPSDLFDICDQLLRGFGVK